MRLAGRAGWAIAASVGAHALLVVVCAALVRRAPEPTSQPPTSIDTRVTFADRRAPDPPAPALTVTPPIPDPPPPDPPASPEPPAAPPEAPAVEAGGPPLARAFVAPAVLPPELLARVRDFAPTPTSPDPMVTPAAATTPPARPAARPAHGALAAGQRVVYLLDASGSMGEWGKFDAARDAIGETLALQPAAVDVRVVVYAAVAEVVAPAALASRGPGGRGDHLAGLRAALDQRPDFVVWFTDADDLPTAAVRTALRRTGKPVTVVVMRVGAGGVAAPVEVR